MRGKKFLASVLSVSVLSIYPFISANAQLIDRGELFPEKAITIDTPLKQTSYLSFTGTVKEIETRQAVEGSEALRYVFVEGKAGQVAYFVLTENTYILNEDQLEVGAKVTGFYDANKPMIMIYPPQYPVEVVAVNQAGNIKLDLFDQDLVSADGMLKLNVTKQTEIVTQDGTDYQGELSNQKLIVFFEASTKSIPAQTNPTKVIVLQEGSTENSQAAGNLLDDLDDLEKAEQLKVLINGQKIAVPAAYVNHKGTLMIPLRAVAEGLNLKLTWNKALAQVVVDNKIMLTIGQDKYLNFDSKVISLGAAPELKNGKTFVPLNFFKEVLGKAAVSLDR